jgi:predicted AAA+ superfamily ATPase
LNFRVLLSIDEIQEAKGGITSLKYFYEQAPQYHITAAGSYLGLSLQQDSSFPVGKVDFLELNPLSFYEFILANKQDALLELIKDEKWNILNTFKPRVIELLKHYYYIGGMPEVVSGFLSDENYLAVRKRQKNILTSYQSDFAKHAPIKILPRINMVWNSIPAQLSKENRKFIFGLIKKGARAKDFELALEWLIGSGLISKVHRVSKPGIPLKAYEDQYSFKVFFVDIGLLGAMSDLDKGSIINGNKIFEEFKGALTEQYVFQQLKRDSLFYWSAKSSTGEIDFLLQNGRKVIPIEVKAEENLQAKSLRAFHKKFNPEWSVRISMSDYRQENWLINIPLYAISNELLSQLN